MGEEVKISVIKKTQDSLGKYLKRPPLTEKLLKKPPFRFLHDIITAVIRQYGLMEGLFTAEEMVSDNVKDKESKLAFLQKVIDTMKLLTGASLTVRPSKIVAGQEAEKTNELLQAIAKALEKKLNSKKAVEQVLGKSKDATAPEAKGSKTTTNKNKETKEATVNGKEKTNRRKDSKVATTEKKEKSKAAGAKESSRKSKDQKPKPEQSKPLKNGIEEHKEQPPMLGVSQEPLSLGAPVEELVTTSYEPSAPELTPDPPVSLPPAPEELPAELGVSKEEVAPLAPLAAPIPSSTTTPQHPPASASIEAGSSSTPVLGSEELPHASPDPSTGGSNEATRAPTAVASSPVPARPGSVRPGSARPRPLTARPAAPRLKERVVRPAVDEPQTEPTAVSTNLIQDTAASKQEEDDSTFIVEEAEPATQETTEVAEPPPSNVTLPDPTEPQGHLVSQILGTQRELEEQDGKDGTQGEDWKWTGKDAAKKEVFQLREAVQGLVRAANPLGRLLDFLQEDVESMQVELEQWQAENSKLRADIAREKQITNESLQPLRKELAELITQVDQQKQANAALKTAVLLNDKKLMDMLLKD